MDIRYKVNSIRAFIGAKDFGLAWCFYRDLCFEERVLSEKLSFFTMEGKSFYLQDYYVVEWVNNSMMLLEVKDLDKY